MYNDGIKRELPEFQNGGVLFFKTVRLAGSGVSRVIELKCNTENNYNNRQE